MANASDLSDEELMAVLKQEHLSRLSDEELLSALKSHSEESSPRVESTGNPYFPKINGRQVDVRQQDDSLMRQLPGRIVDSGLEGGGAAIGQAAGASTGPFAPAFVPILGGAGAFIGNSLGQGRKMLNGEQKGYHLGEALGAIPTGAIPGASLAAAPIKAVAKEGLKYAAANTLGKTIQTGVDEHRLPTAEEAALSAGAGAAGAGVAKFIAAKEVPSSFNRLRDAKFQDMRPEGFVAPPHSMDRGSDLLSSMAGKTSLEAEAAIRNQPKVNRMVREDVKLAGPEPMMESEFVDLKSAAGAVYQKVDEIGNAAKAKLAAIESELGAPGGHDYAIQRAARQQEITRLETLAGADTVAFRKAQDHVRDLQTSLDTGSTPHPQITREALNTAKERVKSIAAGIEAATKEAGVPELADRFQAARTDYAKTSDLEDSTTRSTGYVDARKLGQMYENDKGRLTGKMERVGAFASAFKDEARDANIVSAPGVNKMSSNQALQSASKNTPAGYMAAIAGVAGKPVRKFLLSDFMQDYLAKPVEAGPSMRAAILKQVLARQGRQ